MGNVNEKGNLGESRNLIWVDPNVDKSENMSYKEQLDPIKNLKIFPRKKIENAISDIKSIKFNELIVIISGSFYSDFIKSFKENILDIYALPKIIIFTSLRTKKLIMKNLKKDELNNSFYYFGGIKTDFLGVKNFITEKWNYKENLKKSNNAMLGSLFKIVKNTTPGIGSSTDEIKKRNNEEGINELTFEYIDCAEKLVLPLFYKSLIEKLPDEEIKNYTESLYKKYSSNKHLGKLIQQLRSIKDIPIEIISKFYARLYTIESQFYRDINKDLRENIKDNFMTYIKVLYEGVKSKSLPIASNKILYRGSKILNKDIDKIKKCLKEKLPEFPGAIVFSKLFLSFSKDINIAKQSLKEKIDDSKLSKVLYIIEKDNKLDYSLYTHSDMEKISFFPDEKEVLFFPFSSFEIKDIQEKIDNDEKIYEIKLSYLGKYLKELDDLEESIPNDSEFKNQLIEMGLIPEEKMENSKEIIQKYQEYKENINEIIDKNNEIEIIYDLKSESEIRVFGKTFVENNKEICKIVFEDYEYDLVEYFKIEDYTNEKISILKIKLRYIKNITDMSYMFRDCKSLLSITDLYKLNLENISSISYMFSECSSLIALSDIFDWKTNNITDMGNLFNGCKVLASLPNISKWNTSKVKNMESMFSGCESLVSLPDISNWNTNNVTNMGNLFNGCKSLASLPDISKWNIDKVTNMKNIFESCSRELKTPLKFMKQ